jgi:hypothetical protein
LVILNSGDAKVLENIPSPGNSFLEYPEWIKESHKIAAIVVSKTGKSIMFYDLETKTWTEILKTGFVNIDHLKSDGDYLFFNGGFTGIDEIYSFKLSEGKLSKLSNSKFGAFYPDVSMGKGLLTYSSYSSKGYDVVLKSVNLASTEEFTMPDTINEQSFSSVNLHADTTVQQIVETQASDFIEKPYHKVSNLFRFHSWAPYWFDYMDPNIDDPQISPGITLLSQNELSTAFTSLGYERINGTNFLHTGFTYKGFVPVIDFSTNYGGVSSVAADTILTNLQPSLNSSLSTYIPLTLSSGKVLTGIQPSLNLSYSSAYFYSSKDDTYKSGIGFIEPGFYMYSYLRTTIRDLQPRLGFTINTKLSSAIFDNESRGNIGTMRINLYLPGIARNQGFKLKGEWQNQKSNLLYFQNQLVLPRGYLQKTFLKMDKYSVDYAFPIMYPDISAGSLLYLKRIRGNFFYDYMVGRGSFSSTGLTENPVFLKSEGIELYADYHVLRFIFELSSGIRFTYLPQEKSVGAQILFTVNLDKFL